MKRFLFTIVQILWGAPQTLLGACLYLFTVGCPRFSYHGARCTVWKYASSVSLGLFIFVAENPLKQGLVVERANGLDVGANGLDAAAKGAMAGGAEGKGAATRGAAGKPAAVYVDQRLVAHEFGHCIQSLIFGPLYLVAFGLPSFIWAMVPALRKRRTRTNTSYYRFYSERFANFLVEHIVGEHPLR